MVFAGGSLRKEIKSKIHTDSFRPEDATVYYFITFTSGERETEEIVERHDINIEVMVEGSAPLGEVVSTLKE